MNWWWILGGAAAGYLVMGFVTLAVAAYARGQFHADQRHSDSLRDCGIDGCAERNLIYAFAFVLWWLAWILAGLDSFLLLFEKGGQNSRLPPENQHPAPIQEPDRAQNS